MCFEESFARADVQGLANIVIEFIDIDHGGRAKKMGALNKNIPFVDLFCGAGGLSVGFEQAGFKSVFANDYEPNACLTYARNHDSAHVHHSDIAEVTGQQIREITGLESIPLVIGGPNCQGVSLRGKRNPNDPKNQMFFHYKRIIEELSPDWFVMENVPGLMHRHNRELATDIFAEFDSIGYKCGGEVLLAADYGVPQLRYRFILIGNRHGLPIYFPNPTHGCPIILNPERNLFSPDEEDESRPAWITVHDAISDLPPIENGGGTPVAEYAVNDRTKLSAFQREMRIKAMSLYNHVCHKTSDYNIELIKYISQGKNWKSIPTELRPERFQRVALKDHTTTYGRLRWDMPSRTVTTYFNNISSGAFTHPEQHRGISVREGSRLQSFPDAFQFEGPLAQQYRQVGNAVPCMLAFHVAKLLSRKFEGRCSEADGHPASVEFDSKTKTLLVHRPLLGMRFNLDKYLVVK